MNYVNIKLLVLLQLLCQAKGRKYVQKVPLCWGVWFCLSSCSSERSHTAGQCSSGSTETICNNLNMRKKNYFVNEQFCSREAVRFFWDPVVSCWHLKHFIFVTTPFQGKHFSYCVSHKLPSQNVLFLPADSSLLCVSSGFVLQRHCWK